MQGICCRKSAIEFFKNLWKSRKSHQEISEIKNQISCTNVGSDLPLLAKNSEVNNVTKSTKNIRTMKGWIWQPNKK